MEFMKKIGLLLTGAMMVCAASAQVLEQGESGLVYYSPKTALNLEFTYIVETRERGVFSDFSEDMLGVKDVVKETATIYTLHDVHVGTSTTTDYSRPHKVSAESGIPMLLSINEKGLLTGYNIAPEQKHPAAPKHEHSQQPGGKSRITSTSPAPYPEEVLKAASLNAQAYEAAKQIFHLREMRMYLLNGEVEHAPADGKAMELVLAELDKQERILTELFVGKTDKSLEQKSVRIEPTNAGHLLFFSEENGFTDGDNIDADTIEVRMVCQPHYNKAEDLSKKKKGVELSPIVYNIPGYCGVNIFYKGQNIASRAIPVAQLGIDVALPKSMFTDKELPHIVFSEKTGNITSISK